MDFEAVVGKLNTDQTQDLLGVCAQNLELDQIVATLTYVLSKSKCADLGERLIDFGSRA